MMRYQRPDPPANFETAVAAARQAVRTAIAAGRRPEFPDRWGAFKPVFSEAQSGKCGYCDNDVTANQDGDVEHFAPKSEVKALGAAPETWGVEASNSSNVRGRKLDAISASGYHWLAYHWGNYLLSCRVCNAKWKRTLFPVKEPPPRTVPPSENLADRALLLNPFVGPDPAKHLKFNEDGSVEPWKGSRYGQETIKTVGLGRPSICFRRRDQTSDAYQALRELAEASKNGDAAGEARALRDLARLGQARRVFAGCVRAIAQQELGVSWRDIEAAAAVG